MLPNGSARRGTSTYLPETIDEVEEFEDEDDEPSSSCVSSLELCATCSQRIRDALQQRSRLATRGQVQSTGEKLLGSSRQFLGATPDWNSTTRTTVASPESSSSTSAPRIDQRPLYHDAGELLYAGAPAQPPSPGWHQHAPPTPVTIVVQHQGAPQPPSSLQTRIRNQADPAYGELYYPPPTPSVSSHKHKNFEASAPTTIPRSGRAAAAHYNDYLPTVSGVAGPAAAALHLPHTYCYAGDEGGVQGDLSLPDHHLGRGAGVELRGHVVYHHEHSPAHQRQPLRSPSRFPEKRFSPGRREFDVYPPPDSPFACGLHAAGKSDRLGRETVAVSVSTTVENTNNSTSTSRSLGSFPARRHLRANEDLRELRTSRNNVGRGVAIVPCRAELENTKTQQYAARNVDAEVEQLPTSGGHIYRESRETTQPSERPMYLNDPIYNDLLRQTENEMNTSAASRARGGPGSFLRRGYVEHTRDAPDDVREPPELGSPNAAKIRMDDEVEDFFYRGSRAEVELREPGEPAHSSRDVDMLSPERGRVERASERPGELSFRFRDEDAVAPRPEQRAAARIGKPSDHGRWCRDVAGGGEQNRHAPDRIRDPGLVAAP